MFQVLRSILSSRVTKAKQTAWRENHMGDDAEGRIITESKKNKPLCCFPICLSCSVHSFMIPIENRLSFSCSVVIFITNWCVINIYSILLVQISINLM